MAELLLATANGQLILCDTEEVRPKVVFRCREDEALMGLCTDGDHVYVASLDRLFKLRTGDYEVVGRSRRFWPSPDFHQMNLYDGRLYATATKRNEIWIFDTRLRNRKKFRIPPPIPGKPVKYKKNYNHINAVVREGDSFYVNLNWINHVQYGESGVLVASADFRKREVFPYAWESHDFQFIDGKKTAICSTSGSDKDIRHPLRSGLMVEGELLWEHNPDESFCKALCHDQEHYYMGGGRKAERNKRKEVAGIVYIIRRTDHRLVKTLEHDLIKGVRGALVL